MPSFLEILWGGTLATLAGVVIMVSIFIFRWWRLRAFPGPLPLPILGNLYNKEALVKSLLTKSIPPECSHIKALKDVTAIKLVRTNNNDSSGGKLNEIKKNIASHHTFSPLSYLVPDLITD